MVTVWSQYSMKMRSIIIAFVCMWAACANAETVLLDGGWTFRLEGETEMRPVRVPHDWAIERGFLKPGACPGQGDLPFVGKGLYRRAFDGFTPPPGGRTYLTLDGVQCRSVVRLNGKVVGGRPFGYASETIDVTDALVPTGNVLEVEAENVEKSSRWYPGSGIFRDVTVRVCPPDHVKPNTLFVRTLEATEKSARVAVSFEHRGGVSNFTFTVENPRLWSPERPALYELELFGEAFRYGIRTAAFDPAKGFFLNGVRRQMRGVCLHHDLGVFGAEFNRDAARRQLTLLKEMGCDAIRTSHNFPAPQLLDLCDELGLMVMAEAFDEWKVKTVEDGPSTYWDEWHERLVREFVRRDRTHPCIVMWSAGNELGEDEPSFGKTALGVAIAKELTALFHEEDPEGRPVTAGHYIPSTITNGIGFATDVFGGNYLPQRYAEMKGVKGVIGTETCSAIATRGFYLPRDLENKRAVTNRVNSYGYCVMHGNDYIPDVEFAAQDANPHVYGEFVWTGFDYIGEPDPWRGHSRSSYFGIFDLCGFPKDSYWQYRSHWRPDVPTAHILPHWNWKAGDRIPVIVYTSGDEAELFVNGVSQGRRTRGPREYRLRWNDVEWKPGTVSVRTWRKGRPWAEDKVETSGPFARFVFTDEVYGDLIFRTATAVDAAGRFVPEAAEPVSYAVPEGYSVVGTCNGDAAEMRSLRAPEIRSFYGKALIVFRRQR